MSSKSNNKVEVQKLPYMGEREEFRFQRYAHDPKLRSTDKFRPPTASQPLADIYSFQRDLANKMRKFRDATRLNLAAPEPPAIEEDDGI